MPIYYTVTERPNPLKPTEPAKFYATAKALKKTELDEIAKLRLNCPQQIARWLFLRRSLSRQSLPKETVIQVSAAIVSYCGLDTAR